MPRPTKICGKKKQALKPQNQSLDFFEDALKRDLAEMEVRIEQRLMRIHHDKENLLPAEKVKDSFLARKSSSSQRKNNLRAKGVLSNSVI